MRPRLTIVGAVLLMGCSDSTAPGPGTFRAGLSGARSGSLSGESNGSVIFTVEYPTDRFTVRMFDTEGDQVQALVLHCPGGEPPASGSYTVSTSAADCAGNYALAQTTQDGGVTVLESAAASSGQLIIQSLEGNELTGSFNFEGTLVVGADPGGTIRARGTFSATIQP